MKVGVSILVENTTPVPGLIGEYGFAALVAADDQSYLFDTGSAGALFKNADNMGIDLCNLKGIIISHGHFDHTGALLPLASKLPGINIFSHPDIFCRRYVPNQHGHLHNISCHCGEKQLKDIAVLNYTRDFKAISPGIYLSGEIPRETEFEDTGGNFWVEADDGLVPDQIIDDMALIVDHPRGLIIISGCAHAGIINTIEHAIRKTGKKRIQAFIGGTHLMGASEHRLEKTIEHLRAYDIDRLIVSHCTGFYAAARLRSELGDKVVKGESGMSFIFE